MAAQEQQAHLLQNAGMFNAQVAAQLEGYALHREGRQLLQQQVDRLRQQAMDEAGIQPRRPVDAPPLLKPIAKQPVPSHCKDCGTALEDGRCFPCSEQRTIKRAVLSGEGWAQDHSAIMAGMRAW